MHIREFLAASDLPSLRACVVALQDFERALDSRLPEGEEMADAYLEQAFRRLQDFAGKIFVAEEDNRVVGCVTVLGAYRLDDPSDAITPFAYVDDLLVVPEHRRQGIGQALLAEAEAYAKSCGQASIRLRVKGGNREARAFYQDVGFSDYELELEKWL
jgi:ribosomal protein S18 acetylase RimI-like enzyme